jgi:deoxycytidylate deaminase
MAAVLVTNDGVVVGMNKRKTHPLQARYGKNEKAICLHAEIDALAKASRLRYNIEGGRMYVARVKKDGQVGSAKPCTGCARALIAFGVDKVEWTE